MSADPQHGHPNLHRSSEPRCLHAYAVSRAGAQRILQFLSDPWISYQTAVDIALPTLIHTGALSGAFSIEPPWVIQAKTEFASDVQSTGRGSAWGGYLMDSTWDRVMRFEGQKKEWVEAEVDVRHPDPATVYRAPLSETD